MTTLLADTWALTQRWLIHLRRDRMSLMLGIIQPLILLTLAGPLLHHIVRDAADVEAVRAFMRDRFATEDYLTFLFSGVAVFTILVNSVLGGIPIVFDRETGFMDKVLASPISRLAIPASRFVYVIIYSLMQVAIIGAVALALGVRPHGSALLAVAALVGYGALLAAGISVLSLALAFVFPHHSIFFAITGFMLSPLLILSPTFVARDAMPAWMQTAALLNPMTHAIEPIRAAFLGADAAWLASAGGLLAFDAACFALAVVVLRRRLD
ncbi:MAG: ABC transporter permease [Planctomycetes bacterium]|nr:ABC transporter permease [Planctomycetota bacterium]